MNTYTHGHHDLVLRSHRLRTVDNSAAYLVPRLNPQASLLDIGAGPGTITLDFAARVARVSATEIGPAELSLSQQLADERGADNVDFSVEDVHALSFAESSFDIVHAREVLQHVADPVTALREMARVTKPGGVVAVRDADYAGFVWWPRIPAPDDWLRLYSATARANGSEPDAGRRLLSWPRSAGFRNIAPTSSTWCYATGEDRQEWGGMWAQRIAESALARQLVDCGLAATADLSRISAGWVSWAESEDGWLSIPHGEILAEPDRTPAPATG